VQRSAAGVGTAVFFVVGPGLVAGLVPWLISGWQVRGPVSPLAIIRVFGIKRGSGDFCTGGFHLPRA
jgi:hypothetical protein